jgi:hypothetical protein
VRKICWAAAALLALAAGGAFSATAAAQDEGGLDVVKVRRNFYMIAGAGGNIGVQIGRRHVLVNAGTAAASEKVLAALKKLTDLPIRYIINVDAGPEFVGGNEKLSRAGYTIFTNALATRRRRGDDQRRRRLDSSHDSVLRRMSAMPRAIQRAMSRRSSRRASPAHERRGHRGAAPAGGPQQRRQLRAVQGVGRVVTGDVMDMTSFPVIDLANGGASRARSTP